MTDPQETSAGETMSEERLAEIRAMADPHGPYVEIPADNFETAHAIAELLAEVERLRGVEARHGVYPAELKHFDDNASAAAIQRAETAERELAEMRERVGEEPRPFLAAAMAEVTPDIRKQFEEEWAKAMADWDGKHVIYKSPIELGDEWSYETLTRTGWRRCTTPMTEEYARKRAADSDRNRLVHRKASPWRAVGEGEVADGG